MSRLGSYSSPHKKQEIHRLRNRRHNSFSTSSLSLKVRKADVKIFRVPLLLGSVVIAHLFSLETIAPYEDIFISCSASFIWPGNRVVVVRSHYHSSTTETMCLRLLLLRSLGKQTHIYTRMTPLYILFIILLQGY